MVLFEKLFKIKEEKKGFHRHPLRIQANLKKKKSFTFSFPTPVLPFILNFATFSNSLATFLAIWSLNYILVSFTTLRRLRTMMRHISCIHGHSKLVELLTNPGCVMRTQPHSNYYFAHWYVWTLFKRNTATKRHRIIDHLNLSFAVLHIKSNYCGDVLNQIWRAHHNNENGMWNVECGYALRAKGRTNI